MQFTLDFHLVVLPIPFRLTLSDVRTDRFFLTHYFTWCIIDPTEILKVSVYLGMNNVSCRRDMTEILLKAA